MKSHQNITVSEYDDKPLQRKPIESHSQDRFRGIKISNYLKRDKGDERCFSNDRRGQPGINNSLKIRKTKQLSQTRLKNLLNNNPNKRTNQAPNKTIKRK